MERKKSCLPTGKKNVEPRVSLKRRIKEAIYEEQIIEMFERELTFELTKEECGRSTARVRISI